MNKNKIIFGCLAGLSLLSTSVLTGCGDKFQEEYPWMIGKQEDQDQDQEDGAGRYDMTVLEQELRGAIPYMLNYSHEPDGSWQPHNYQYQRANNIDNYCGYWTTSKATFGFGGALPTLLTYPNDYLDGPFDNSVFTQSYDALHFAVDMKDKNDETKIVASRPEWRAVALIIQAYMGHEVVDFIGACPYNDWRERVRNRSHVYEAGPDVYAQIFDDLDEAVSLLKETQPDREALARIEDFEGNKSISDGDWRRWVKFANSIKLRMAMNMVKYDAATAQAKALEAVNDEIGVLVEGDRDIAYNPSLGNGNSWYFIGNVWNDIRLNANMEIILKHFNHPVISHWFDANPYPIINKLTGEVAPTDVYGIRAGISMNSKNTGNKDKGVYSAFSTLQQRSMPMPFLKTSEVLFLRAEGALRGWAMGGTAKEFYEAGIRTVFTENALDGYEDYIAQDELPVVDYVDPYDSENNTPGRVSIGVKWNESDSKEVCLEKIITQKWIACFPLGAEAWTTFRRTGYPRLIPCKINGMADMGVDLELQIRRIPRVVSTNNTAEMNSLGQAIGGDQKDLSIRVFWDVPTERRGNVNPENNTPYVIPVNF